MYGTEKSALPANSSSNPKTAQQSMKLATYVYPLGPCSSVFPRRITHAAAAFRGGFSMRATSGHVLAALPPEDSLTAKAKGSERDAWNMCSSRAATPPSILGCSPKSVGLPPAASSGDHHRTRRRRRPEKARKGRRTCSHPKARTLSSNTQSRPFQNNFLQFVLGASSESHAK